MPLLPRSKQRRRSKYRYQEVDSSVDSIEIFSSRSMDHSHDLESHSLIEMHPLKSRYHRIETQSISHLSPSDKMSKFSVSQKLKNHCLDDEIGYRGYKCIVIGCTILILFLCLQIIFVSPPSGPSAFDEQAIHQMMSIIEMENRTEAIQSSYPSFDYNVIADILNLKPRQNDKIQAIRSFMLDQNKYIVNQLQHYPVNKEEIALNGNSEYETLQKSIQYIDSFNTFKFSDSSANQLSHNVHNVEMHIFDGIDKALHRDQSLLLILGGNGYHGIFKNDLFVRSTLPVVDADEIRKHQGMFIQNATVFRSENRRGFDFRNGIALEKVLLVPVFVGIDCNHQVKRELTQRMEKIVGFIFEGTASEKKSVTEVIIELADDLIVFCADHITAQEIADTVKSVLERSGHRFIISFNIRYGQSEMYRLFKSLS